MHFPSLHRGERLPEPSVTGTYETLSSENKELCKTRMALEWQVSNRTLNQKKKYEDILKEHIAKMEVSGVSQSAYEKFLTENSQETIH